MLEKQNSKNKGDRFVNLLIHIVCQENPSNSVDSHGISKIGIKIRWFKRIQKIGERIIKLKISFKNWLYLPFTYEWTNILYRLNAQNINGKLQVKLGKKIK